MEWLFFSDNCIYRLKSIVTNSCSKTTSLILAWFFLSFSTAIIPLSRLYLVSLYYLFLKYAKFKVSANTSPPTGLAS